MKLHCWIASVYLRDSGMMVHKIAGWEISDLFYE